MILMSFLSACEEHTIGIDEETDPPVTIDKRVQLELFTRTNEYGTPVLRSLADENGVGMTPWILVFSGSNDNAVFVEAVQAFQLSGINKRYVMLTEQTTACRLLILANPQNHFYMNGDNNAYTFSENNLNTLLSGKTLSYACLNLLTMPLNNPQTSVPYSGNEQIPMSYLLDVPSIDKDTEIGTSGSLLELKRVVAKVIIKNEDPDFAFDAITAVVNAPKQGQLHLLGSTLMNNSGNLVEYNTGDSYVTDMIIPNSSGTTENDPVYLYESSTANKTYFIIKGVYAGKTYYYKVSIIDANKNPVDILRNYKYTVTITSIRGPGFETINDLKTLANNNTNITYDVRIVDDSSFEIAANDNYYLGLSNSIFIAYTDGISGSETEFTLFTLTTNCTIDFPDARYISHNSGNGAISLTYPVPDKPGAGQKSEIPITNNSNIPVATDIKAKVRSSLGNGGYITLKLGDLEKSINIRSSLYGAIPSSGETLIIKDIYGYEYYLFSGYVEGTNTKDWIKLTTDAEIIRNDSASIVVDNGKIRIIVEPNTTGTERRGTVYLTAGKNPEGSQGGSISSFRIKLDIAQRGS